MNDWRILGRAERRASRFMSGSLPASSARMAALLPELTGEIRDEDLLSPAMTYQSFAVAEIGDGAIRLADGTSLGGLHAISGELAGAEEIIVAAATLGTAIEARIAALFAERRAMRALALEELATASLFELSDQITARIGRLASARGHKLSERYAPGDVGIPFSLQPRFCELAGAADLGITLSASGMMRPVKSLCFLFATGANLNAAKRARSCDTCRARERCRYRRGTQEGVAA
jgi:hypothetical protein